MSLAQQGGVWGEGARQEHIRRGNKTWWSESGSIYNRNPIRKLLGKSCWGAGMCRESTGVGGPESVGTGPAYSSGGTRIPAAWVLPRTAESVRQIRVLPGPTCWSIPPYDPIWTAYYYAPHATLEERT